MSDPYQWHVGPDPWLKDAPEPRRGDDREMPYQPREGLLMEAYQQLHEFADHGDQTALAEHDAICTFVIAHALDQIATDLRNRGL